jgi:hypothetical protein
MSVARRGGCCELTATGAAALRDHLADQRRVGLGRLARTWGTA